MHKIIVFLKKYQPVVLKIALEGCLKDISTFTEHYGILETYVIHPVRYVFMRYARYAIQASFSCITYYKITFLCVMYNYQLHRV